MLFQLDLARIIIVYIGQGAFLAFFAYIAYKLLTRGTYITNIMLSCFYIFICVGFGINFLYALLISNPLVKILNAITNFCVFFGLIFLMVFNLIMLKSENVITKQKQFMIIVTFGLLLFLMYLIPDGVIISESTNWKPHWSLPFFLYVFFIVTTMAVVPTLYFSFLIYKKFQNEELKKKWKFFFIGIIGVFFVMYGTMVSNTLNNPSFRMAWSLISFSTILWGYLLYYGVGRQF